MNYGAGARATALVGLLVAGCAAPEGGGAHPAELLESRGQTPPRLGPTDPTDEAIRDAVEELRSRPLEAEDAVRIALLRNQRIQLSLESLGLARADLLEAGLLPNPVLSGELLFAEDDVDTRSLEVELATDLLGLVFLPARRRLAVLALEERRLEVAHRIWNELHDVRVAYYEARAAGHGAEVLGLVAEARAASAEFARRLHEAGNIDELNLRRAEAGAERAQLEFDLQQAEAFAAREVLNRVLGVWGEETEYTLPAALELPPALDVPDGPERVAVEWRLDVAAADRAVRRLAARAELVDAVRWIPAAEIGASGDREAGGEWSVGPAWVLELPLLDTGRAEVLRSATALRSAHRELVARATEARSEVRAALAAAQAADRASVAYRERIVPLSARVVELTQLEYNYMLVGTFELLAAKEDQTRAYREYVDAVARQWITRVEFERTLGRRTTAGEATTIQSLPLPADGPDAPHQHEGK